MYFLVWRPGAEIQVLARSAPGDTSSCLQVAACSAPLRAGERDSELSGLSYKGADPILGAPASASSNYPGHLPKAPPPNAAGAGLQHVCWGRCQLKAQERTAGLADFRI